MKATRSFPELFTAWFANLSTPGAISARDLARRAFREGWREGAMRAAVVAGQQLEHVGERAAAVAEEADEQDSAFYWTTLELHDPACAYAKAPGSPSVEICTCWVRREAKAQGTYYPEQQSRTGLVHLLREGFTLCGAYPGIVPDRWGVLDRWADWRTELDVVRVSLQETQRSQAMCGRCVAKLSTIPGHDDPA